MFAEMARLPPHPDFAPVAAIAGRYGLVFV
jgi:hypothetical protein